MLFLVRMPGKKSSGFSIKSKKHIKTMNLSNGHPDAVLIEGDLGPITEVSMFEDKVLVVKGRHGTISVELSKADLCFSGTPTKLSSNEREIIALGVGF